MCFKIKKDCLPYHSGLVALLLREPRLVTHTLCSLSMALSDSVWLSWYEGV